MAHKNKPSAADGFPSTILSRLGGFDDRVVLITGASSGIGREAALTFARMGARVAVAARRREQLEAVADAITRKHGRALIVPTDVTDRTSIERSVRTLLRRWGRIDLLVNSAGILIPSPVAEMREDDLQSMWRVNVLGALAMMQAVLPSMQQHGGGTIINVASLAGRRGISPLGGYCATKFALVGMCEALRTEVPPEIHVGLVLPGVIDTPMAHAFDADEALAAWPAALNMPASWVVAAIVLAARFRLREISVPPGAATMEVIAALAPAVSDRLVRWGTAAGQMLARATRSRRPPAPTQSTRAPRSPARR